MRNLLVKDLLSELNTVSQVTAQKSPGYLEWINSDLVSISEEFAQKNRLIDSRFVKNMNRIFKTKRFELLLKRWLVEYYLKLFRALDYSNELKLEDNPLNRFAVERYNARFKSSINLKWHRMPGISQRVLSILLRAPHVLYFSLRNGIRISVKRKRYKIMREAVWGIYNTGGYYFHDDFLVDGNEIKKEDILLFSRGYPKEAGRLKGYHDAKRSPYSHFELLSLPIGIDILFSRIIPRYIISSLKMIFIEIHSPYFSLYWSIYLYFIYNAMPYEKIFSNFKVISELGHNYFSTGHIPEAIVCQNYGTKYYLMHWSDNSVGIDKYLLSFLGCDGFLLWGKAHLQGVEGESRILFPTGYVFKKFIKEVKLKKDKVLQDIGIKARGKIISFFDESFGGECKMTEEHYVIFWETALKLAQTEKDNTILIKTKDLSKFNNLSSGELKTKFIDMKAELEKLPNVYIIDYDKWSFVETIGVSDIVVTQGMTSSSTIAIICGIQGLYLDQAEYSHPFSGRFKDKIVFNDPEKLLSKIHDVINEKDNLLAVIPEDILRGFDAYSDDRGIDIFRSILSGEIKRKVGIIVQARMGSTRLPGKIMKTILGKSMLEIVIERLKKSRNAQELIIATTQNKKDDTIENLAGRLDIVCFRGSEDDVLSRYYETAKKYNLDVIVRITSDCPLMDPLLVDKLIKYYFDNLPVDYVSNTIKRTYPRGFDLEVFGFESLKRAAREAHKPYQREHVTPYIYENMRVLNFENEHDYSKYRVTVDTQEDFELVSYIYEKLAMNYDFGYEDVIKLLDTRPDLAAINQYIEQKKITL